MKMVGISTNGNAATRDPKDPNAASYSNSAITHTWEYQSHSIICLIPKQE